MVSAIVILFNPDMDHVSKFCEQILAQVEHLIVVDNTPPSLKRYGSDAFLHDRITYLDLKDNYGIATAQNKGIEYALTTPSDYVIFFDQDSSIPENFIASLVALHQKIEQDGYKVAAVGPNFIDTKTNVSSPIIRFDGVKVLRIAPDPARQYTRADYIISSGSLVSTDALREIGHMMDQLFIDYVDLEWGLRAKQKGYLCFVGDRITMHHTIGDSSAKVPIIKRNVNVHSDFRKYFLVRNSLYLSLYSDLPTNWRLVQFPKTFMYMGFMLLFVSPKWSTLRATLLGLRDGLFKKMNKGSM